MLDWLAVILGSSVPDTVYTVPDKSSDEAHINTLIGASAYYVDMVHSGSHVPLTPGQIHYTYQKGGAGAITSVQAEGRYTTNQGVLVTSDPKTVTVTGYSQNTVTVITKHQTVALTVNSEAKGGFSGDSPSGYSFQLSYGGPVGSLPQAPSPKP